MSRVIIDVRSQEEWNTGHVEGAILIPHDVIDQKIAAQVPDKNTEIIVYCRSGMRAGRALDVLKGMGYTNVTNYGGYEDAKRKLGL